MNRSDNSKVALVYVRRSTDKQEESLSQQLDWAIRTAKNREISLSVPKDIEHRLKSGGISQAGDIYCDDAITGADETRPGLLALMRRIKQDKSIAFLFVWDRSRLGRFERNEVGMKLEKDIAESGITIVMQRMDINPKLISDGPQYEDLAANADWIAGARMRVDLAENTLRGLRDTAEEGLWCGGNPPYGFVRAAFNPKSRVVGEVLQSNRGIRGQSGEAVVVMPGIDAENQARLKVVRHIATEYAGGLVGLHAIAKELNQRGIPSPYAGRSRRQQDASVRKVWGKWTVNSVRGILENPLYSGKMAWGRREYGSIRRFDKNSETGYRKVQNNERIAGSNKAIAKEHRDIENWLLVTPAAPYDPIVPFGLFESNLARLKQRAVVGNQRGRSKCSDPNKYPIAVFCGDCGQRMCGHNHGKHSTWMCSKFINSNRELCYNNWVMRDEVVIFVVEQVRRRIHQLANRQRLEAEITAVLDEHRSTQTELEASIIMARANTTRLGDQAKRAYLDHNNARTDHERAMTREVYDQRHEELAQAEDHLRRLESELAMHGIGNDDKVTESLAYLERFDRHLGNLPPDQLRRTFDALGVRLDVKFAPNTTANTARQRLPIGGTLTFGAPGISRNDSPPALAEGGSSNETWVGCGGRI